MQGTNATPVAPTRATTLAQLSEALVGHETPTGGWAYYAGKTSRVEATSWALLAAVGVEGKSLDLHRSFFARSTRPDGLLVDAPGAPANYSHNALALLAILRRFPGDGASLANGLFRALLTTAGVRVPSAPEIDGQNNMLQGWPWIADTFSWVEPTSWCLLALKRAAGPFPSLAARQRIDQAEQLLVDRSCRSGGWNYGNASVLGQSLAAYVPTTAVALLALQDRRDLPAVTRGLAFLEEHGAAEPSGLAMSLALICLRLYDRPVDRVETALLAQWQRTEFLGNLCTIAMAHVALGDADRTSVFRLT